MRGRAEMRAESMRVRRGGTGWVVALTGIGSLMAPRSSPPKRSVPSACPIRCSPDLRRHQLSISPLPLPWRERIDILDMLNHDNKERQRWQLA
jgi:hypothetical protein